MSLAGSRRAALLGPAPPARHQQSALNVDPQSYSSGQDGRHDLQATILHLMGLDHTRLTYRFQGRDFRLTDVAGKVVPSVLA